MNRITVDDSLKSQLDGLETPTEVVDTLGHTLGHFVPVTLLSSDGCPYSAEKLERMRGESGGRPLPEIWKSLASK